MKNKKTIQDCEKKRDSNEEIILFGYRMIFFKFINFMLFFLISFLFKAVDIFFGFVIVYIPLRKYSGGYHAGSIRKCTFLGMIVYSMLVITLKLDILLDRMLVIILLWFIAGIIIVASSPVESKTKPLSQNDIFCFKKKTRLIYLIEVLCSLILLIFKVKYFLLIIMVHIVIAASLSTELLIRKAVHNKQ